MGGPELDLGLVIKQLKGREQKKEHSILAAPRRSYQIATPLRSDEAGTEPRGLSAPRAEPPTEIDELGAERALDSLHTRRSQESGSRLCSPTYSVNILSTLFEHSSRQRSPLARLIVKGEQPPRAAMRKEEREASMDQDLRVVVGVTKSKQEARRPRARRGEAEAETQPRECEALPITEERTVPPSSEQQAR